MIKSILKKLLFVMVAIWLVGALWMAAFSEQFIFWPDPNRPLTTEGEQIFFDRGLGSDSTIGEKVDAKWLSHPDSSQVILYLPGSGGRMTSIFKNLAKNCSVLAPCYPEYEQSEGKASTKTVYETARASMAYLLKQGYRQQDIVVWGHSLGGSPAVYLATIYPKLARVILVNTFDSIQNMGYRRYGPLAIFAGGIFDTIRLAPSAKGVFRQFHVENDEEIPMKAALQLFDALGAADRKFSTLSGNHSYPNVAATLRGL